MPYIKKQRRERLDDAILSLVTSLINIETDNASVGDVNYVISNIIWRLFEYNKSYTTANNLIGVLECVKSEFVRRKLNPYEDEKIKENGDLI